MLQTQIHKRHFELPPLGFSRDNAKLDHTAGPSQHPYETVITVPQGGVVFEEDATATYFYKLMSGSIRLVKMAADGHRQICDFHLAGDLVGYTNTETHAFAAEAIEDCTLLRYRRRDVETLIRTDAAFACELQRLTANGLNGAYAHMVRLCHRSARDRLAWFLIAMTDRSPSGDGWIDLPMSRVDIADYLGMAHETVSRAFTQLKKSGVIIEPTLNRIQVVDRDALEDHLIAA